MPGAKKYEAIVIGVSAGGLYALSGILEKLPAKYPVPVIIVQHRVKDQGDLLEEVLQSKCAIRIKQVEEKEKIIPGIVYIAPPDYHVLIEEDRTFSLSSHELVQFSRPSIDILFQTAAEVFKETLIAIILTGANSDGAAGIVAVQKNGGLTIAQSPEEAMFPFMPRASIETKKTTYIWKLAAIRDFLVQTTR